MNGSEPSLGARLRVMQIIAGAIAAGAVIFLGIVVFLVYNRGQGMAPLPEGSPPVVSYLCAAMLAVQIPLGLFLPAMIVRQGLERLAGEQGPGSSSGDQGALLGLKQTAMIVTLALFEGASFFASIAYLLEAQPFTVAVSAAAILLLLASFPSEGRINSWLGQQRSVLNDLRLRRRSSPPA